MRTALEPNQLILACGRAAARPPTHNHSSRRVSTPATTATSLPIPKNRKEQEGEGEDVDDADNYVVVVAVVLLLLPLLLLLFLVVLVLVVVLVSLIGNVTALSLGYGSSSGGGGGGSSGGGVRSCIPPHRPRASRLVAAHAPPKAFQASSR